MKFPGMTRLNHQGVILMYHRVANPDIDPWSLCVSPTHFEEQMSILKKYGRPIQMQELGQSFRSFSVGRKKIVVTFDDGYADNFYNAKPILERHGIPATFFIVSGAVGVREEFWWDDISRIMVTAKILPKLFEMIIAGKKYSWKVNSEEEQEWKPYRPGTYQNNAELLKSELHYALWETLGSLSLREKKDTIQQIARWAGLLEGARSDYLPMTSEELVSLASCSLFEIGAHTVYHPMLSRLTLNEQKEEIARSKVDLEKIIDRSIVSFAYPHGDYSKDTVKIVQQAGFKNACTVVGQAVTRKSDAYLLPRYTVENWNVEEFEKNLQNWLKTCD